MSIFDKKYPSSILDGFKNLGKVEMEHPKHPNENQPPQGKEEKPLNISTNYEGGVERMVKDQNKSVMDPQGYRESRDQMAKDTVKVLGMSAEDLVSVNERRKIATMETTEMVQGVSRKERMEFVPPQPPFSFQDLIIVFMGSQIITAGIIWITILIQRGTW